MPITQASWIAGMAEHQQLHLGRPDLEAARVDHALQPVGHEEVAVLVHAAHVARAEEALALELDEGRGRGLGSLPVALEHLGAADDDLARFAERHLLQRVGVDHARASVLM
jgi:hypothetical protein